MALSIPILRFRFDTLHYLGAFVIMGGAALVLVPSFLFPSGEGFCVLLFVCFLQLFLEFFCGIFVSVRDLMLVACFLYPL